MKNKVILSGLIFTGLILTAAVSIIGTSENGWRGINRDGKVTGFIEPASWPGQLTQVWKTRVGLGDASPVLVGDKLYLHTKKDSMEYALCLEATTGKTVWEEINNKAPVITGGPASHPGPRSTPYVTDGKVINVGAAGVVTCRNAKTGALIWKSEAYPEVPQFYVGMSPLVTGNKVIVHLNGKEKGTVIAFDLQTGSEIWKMEGQPSTYASPVLMTAFKNMVVVQGEKDLLGISIDKGTVLWKTPTPAETRYYNSSTPVVSGDHVIIAGQGSGSRSFRITREGELYKVTEAWHNPGTGVSFNTPVLKNGFLYGNEGRFGSVFCLNAETGATCWTDTVRNNRFSSVLDLGNVMISLPATGNLIIFKPDNTKYHEIARHKAADTEVYAHPVVAGNNIYVKDKEFLTCWKIQ